MQGWISVDRKLTEHWLWTDKPFSKGQAWIDLIMMVNHEDNKFLHGNEIRLVKRGSRITSMSKLANRWGWSRKKVFDFMNLLEKEQMIERVSNTKETVVTIVKYEDYQSSRNTKETPKKRKGNTEKTPKNTNNNDNNILTNVNIKEYSENQNLNNAIKEFIEFRKKIKSPMTDRAIELLISNLKKLSTDTSNQVAIINQSIMNGWKGVFPLKDNVQDKPKSTNKFNQFPQRGYTTEQMSEIERKLLNKSLGGQP